MTSGLPINIEDLLRHRGVESARVEFKAGWDQETSGPQAVATICAFANDLHNLNGGYVVFGVAAVDGVAQWPLRGLAPEDLEEAQKWMRGRCKRIDPEYQPVLFVEVVAGKTLLVIWAPGSDTRPHRAPGKTADSKDKKYWIRLGGETVDAEANGLLPALMQTTARVPFDDRRAQDARVEDLREARVREFLADVHSGLVDETDAAAVYRNMRLTSKVNAHEVPRNVGLLFFSDDPERWFRGARVEVVHFSDDASGNVIEERTFRGPLITQVRSCLDYLTNLSSAHREKRRDDPEAIEWVSYPVMALREAVVNAVYHRGYDGVPEPTKVYLYPDRMEVVNYPGPVPGLMSEHFRSETPAPPVPARNRRIGELLKELRLAEGRGTGVPKMFRAMRDNGSLAPRFDFDESRSYFRVTLPAHPEYVAISALRDAAHLRARGDSESALRRLQEAWSANRQSALLPAELIRLLARDDLRAAENVFSLAREAAGGRPSGAVLVAMAAAYTDARMDQEAERVLEQMPSVLSASEACEAAILERRAGRHQSAHRYFERMGEAIRTDVRALHEFAQTKMALAGELRLERRTEAQAARRRLLEEAREILERVLQLDAPVVRHAWAWFDLGRVLGWIGAPERERRAAIERAIALQPDEVRFQRGSARGKD